VVLASCHLQLQALDWGLDIALGVEQLHIHNLLHGDLKELNVLRSNTVSVAQPHGRCMVADLPAKFLAPTALAVHGPHILTRICAAPEQVQINNQMLCPGSDCFGLALMLLRMLSWAANTGSDFVALTCALPRCRYTHAITVDELLMYGWFMGMYDGDLLWHLLWNTVLRRALDNNPRNRPHVSEVVAALHNTIQAIQWRRAALS
jgi:hypothetical protein